jgi:hypothetical protein
MEEVPKAADNKQNLNMFIDRITSTIESATKPIEKASFCTICRLHNWR